MNKSLVSVIIATFNYSLYIKDAIQSAIDQDWENLNIFIVDDASTDDTKVIIQQIFQSPFVMAEHYIPENAFRKDEIAWWGSWIANNRKINYIQLKTNGGPSRARNIGLVHAMMSGCQFVQILDADDIMRPDKVSKLIQPILDDPQGVGETYADYILWNVDKNTKVYESKQPYDIQSLYNSCIIHSGSMINCLALQKIAYSFPGETFPRFYDEDLQTCEDYLIHLKISKSFIMVHLAEALTEVRDHSKNSTFSIDQETQNRNYQICKQRAFAN